MTLIAFVLLAAAAQAGPSSPKPRLLADPSLPVFASPFYAHPDFAASKAAPAAPLSADPLSLPAAAIAAAPAGSELKTALAAAEEPGDALSAIDALRRRGPLSASQSAALGRAADGAREAKDVATLARLAVLTQGERYRPSHRAMVRALSALRGLIRGSVFVEAGRALDAVARYEHEPAPDSARDWMAARLEESFSGR